ncbi:alpha/beta hydrolase [Undibacterium sp. TS12]|uniref:alpha/beta fold hydrolase n=1 Tax=Undibacterium sp. TS12 TaxID=2908202 RepID=UPI001F4D1355|nr:alpha/beta hydrolase [Undibacterium sp. TS12]MCH8622809.1 alpha/beta hydrolase [Undibacterium sp. TS12]
MSNDTSPMTEHWITTDAGRLYARNWQAADRQGHCKSPILLLHDSLGCVALWRTFPALLAAQTGRQVIAYDRLGFGQSDARSDVLGMDFIAQEATGNFPALQAHFGFERFVVMGHSVGGGMAVHVAARHANTCDALITESAQAFVEDKTRAGIIEAQQQFREPGALDRLRRYHGDKAEWVLHAWITTWLSPAFANWSLREVLPLVTCPALVLHGEHDEYGSSLHPQQIATLTSGPAQLDIIAGAQHVPHKEQEDWVVSRVGRFLDSNS